MNHCTFFGRPKSINTKHGEIDKVELILQVENKRKGKSEVKKMDYEHLLFEAWGTAAITISKNLTTDDCLLVIDSTARNIDNKVSFRINEFKIVKRENAYECRS